MWRNSENGFTSLNKFITFGAIFFFCQMVKYKQILQTLDSCYINFEEYVHLSELRITSLD